MRNNILLFFVVIATAATLLGFAMMSFINALENGTKLAEIGLATVSLVGFFLLFLNGTFIDSIYFKRMKGVMAIVIVGALLKILHLKFANELISIGIFGIIIIYFFSFLNKPIKRRLDYLKLAWVIVSYTGALLVILHYINRDYQILSSAIMWLAIIEYVRIESGKRKLQKRRT